MEVGITECKVAESVTVGMVELVEFRVGDSEELEMGSEAEVTVEESAVELLVGSDVLSSSEVGVGVGVERVL